MKRRNLSEVQYSSDVPSYLHNSIYKICSGDNKGDYIETATVAIMYNAKYLFGDISEYHRDNYCAIPYVLPNMALSSKIYDLDHDVVNHDIPKVSTMFGLDYGPHVLSDKLLNLTKVVTDAFLDSEYTFSDLLSIDLCICDEFPDISQDNPDSVFPGPVDALIPIVDDISDEYAYGWEDLWDMSTIGGSRPSRPKDEESSSSSTITPPPTAGGAIYLCKISNPPVGNGGTAIADIISVSGSGAISVSGSLVVNLPSI